jgi:hypothetical protein
MHQVSELINPITGDWDMQLIRATFWEEDVRAILTIPVHVGRENVLAWHPEPRGMFTVKSAYKVCRREIMHSQHWSIGGTCSSGGTSVDENMWKRIWKMETE